MYTNEHQWDKEEHMAKMLGKYGPEIEEARERQRQHEAERAERDKNGD